MFLSECQNRRIETNDVKKVHVHVFSVVPGKPGPTVKSLN
jgi:hypothetical protein